MSKYAILDDNNKVQNIIIAESLKIAKEVSKTELVIEVEENDPTVYINGIYLGEGKFELPEFEKIVPLTPESTIAIEQE